MHTNTGWVSKAAGTNGYIQRDSASKSKCTSSASDEIASVIDKIDNEIQEHDRKRKIELWCVEFQQLLEDEGYTEEETEKRVSNYRLCLLEERSATITKFDREKLQQLVRERVNFLSAISGNSSQAKSHNKGETKMEENSHYVKTTNNEDASILIAKITKDLIRSKKRRSLSSPTTTSKKKKKKKHKRNSERSKKSKRRSKSRSRSKKHKKRTGSRSPASSSSLKHKRKRSSSASSSKRKKGSVDAAKPLEPHSLLSPTLNRRSSHKRGYESRDMRKKRRDGRPTPSSACKDRKGELSHTRSADARKKERSKRGRSRDKKASKSKWKLKTRRRKSYSSPTRNTRSSDSGCGFDENVDSRKSSSAKTERSRNPAVTQVGAICLKYDEEEYEDDSDVNFSNSLHDGSRKSSSPIGMEIFVKLKSPNASGQLKPNQEDVENNKDVGIREESSSSSLSYSPVEKYPQRYLDILSDMSKRSRQQISEVLGKTLLLEGNDTQNTLKVENEPKEGATVSIGSKVGEGDVIGVKFTLTRAALRAISVPGLSCGSEAKPEACDTNDEATRSNQNEPGTSNRQDSPTFESESLYRWRSRSKSKSECRSVRSGSSRSSRRSRGNSMSDSEKSLGYRLACRKYKRRRRSHSSSAEDGRSPRSSSGSSTRSRSGSRSSNKVGSSPMKKRSSYDSSCSSDSTSSCSSRSRSRSLSIPRRRGSPSFLDRRRITSRISDWTSRSLKSAFVLPNTCYVAAFTRTARYLYRILN